MPQEKNIVLGSEKVAGWDGVVYSRPVRKFVPDAPIKSTRIEGSELRSVDEIEMHMHEISGHIAALDHQAEEISQQIGQAIYAGSDTTKLRGELSILRIELEEMLAVREGLKSDLAIAARREAIQLYHVQAQNLIEQFRLRTAAYEALVLAWQNLTAAEAKVGIAQNLVNNAPVLLQTSYGSAVLDEVRQIDQALDLGSIVTARKAERWRFSQPEDRGVKLPIVHDLEQAGEDDFDEGELDSDD